MTLTEIKAALTDAGFTGLRTCTGVIPLGEWDPYGLSTANRCPGSRPYEGEIVTAGDKVRVRDLSGPHDHGLAIGLWEPVK